MTLIAHRSQRVEELVDALAIALQDAWPDDPFEAVPILVGSRGMDRWLRHELATRFDGVARLDFVFPGAAFDGAARWLQSLPSAADRSAFWERAPGTVDAWSGPRLVARVLGRIRARLGDPAFVRVRAYLGEVGESVRARELAFAEEVAGSIERLLYDRPEDALAWAADPGSAKDHAWLAEILRDLDGGPEISPARVRAKVAALAPIETGRALHVFGLTTLRPGDKRWLATLARHLDIHVFAFAPSREWWEDIHSKREQLRELREPKAPAETAELLAKLERQNAILAANGEPSRDLQVWLESTGYAEPTTPSHAPRQDDRASTLLGRVQAWTDGAEDNPTDSPWADLAACGSLEVHACHGALRQCEALRDELLRRFAADPTLEPRHVLVMTPDVATHAPLLAAVFARHGDGVPQLPLHIADLGLRAQNPVADALAQLLGLADERVTASRLLEVIASAPVRRRFALREDDVAELRAMVVGSGIRWAWDAADRERHGQPAIDQNTVRFGLERLALGVLMHDLGGLDVVPGPAGSDLAPAVPFDVAGRDGVERFGRLADLFDRLRAVRGRVIEPATSAGWRARLTELIDDFTEVEGESAWLRVEVEEALAELFPDDLGEGLPLDRSAVAATLAGAFDRPLRGDRPITGAITVCALEPMRSVPFRVIAILGLDDGAFPRPGRTPAWDPFAARKHGEYDRRTIDRHLFLEAVLCARDALLLFGTGFEPSRGAPAPMSVVVSELVEVIAAGTGEAPKARRVDHPLQPWSEKAFAAGEGAAAPRLPFDAVWVDAAVAIRGPRRLAGLAATPLDAPWPAEDGETNAIRADELARALARPQEELLRRRLGLSLAPEDATVPDREPLDQGTLEAWSLRDRVLRATEGGAEPDVDALEARLRGEGALQLRAGGRRALEGIVGEAREARRRAEAVPGVRTEALQASCEVGGVVVSAAAADVRLEDGDRRLVWVTASKGANGRAELTAWVTLIVAVAAGEAVVSAHVCGHGKEATLHAPSAADARAHLDALVRTWREVRGGPIPLFPALSRAVALRLAKDAQLSPAGAVEASDAAWSGSSMAAGDHEDPWVSAIFGHLGIEDLAERATEVCERAVRVWGPVLAAGTDAKGANEPEGSDAEDA